MPFQERPFRVTRAFKREKVPPVQAPRLNLGQEFSDVNESLPFLTLMVIPNFGEGVSDFELGGPFELDLFFVSVEVFEIVHG
jgi:hypothetical protein